MVIIAREIGEGTKVYELRYFLSYSAGKGGAKLSFIGGHLTGKILH